MRFASLDAKDTFQSLSDSLVASDSFVTVSSLDFSGTVLSLAPPQAPWLLL